MFVIRPGVIWIGASQIALLLSNFMLLKLFTSQLTVYEFGQYTLCMSIILFARQVLYDPISIVLAKECATSPLQVPHEFRVARLINDRICAVLFMFGFLYLIYCELSSESYANGMVVMSCLVYLCANGAQGVYFNVLNSIRKRKFASLFSIMDSAAKVILVVLVFLLVGKTLIWTLAPIAAGAFTVFLLLRLFIANRFVPEEYPFRDVGAITKRMIWMSVPFFPPAILAAAKSVGDRWMLAGFLGVSELAEYSVLLQIGYSPIMLFVGMVQTFVAPKIYNLCSLEGNDGLYELKKFLQKILFMIIFGVSVACVGAMLLADWAFNILVGENYHALTGYLPFFVFSGALSAAAGILQVAVIGVFKSRDAGALLMVSLLVGVTVTVLLIWMAGFEGAVAGLVISTSATLIIYWQSLCRALNSRARSQNKKPE